MQAKQSSDLSPGRVEQEAPVNSPLVTVGKENLTQKRRINQSYIVKIYDEIAWVPCRFCQSRTHGREIIIGPIAGQLEDLRCSAPIMPQARFR
jgi:hypothetical protein